MFAWFAAAMATDALGLASINPIAASSLIGFGTPPPDVEINFSIVDFHGIEDDTIPYNESSSFGKKIKNAYLITYIKKASCLLMGVFGVNCVFQSGLSFGNLKCQVAEMCK